MNQPDVSVRLATKFDGPFLVECYNNSAEQNKFEQIAINRADSFSAYATVLSIVNERNVDNQLFIINRNGKDVSFFTPQFNAISGTIGGYVFTHPHACKMSVITSIRCMLLHDILRSLSDVACKNLLLNVWHPVMVQAALQVLPNAKVYNMHPCVIFMTSNVNDDHDDYVAALGKFECRNLTGDYAFECTM